MADIAVVGTGLAGTTAAWGLTKAGHRVLMLEGRDEIGGRTRSRPIAEDVLELGGQFIARRHTKIRRLVADAGLRLRGAQATAGLVRWRRPDDARGRLAPPLRPTEPLALARLLRVLMQLSAASTPDARQHLDRRSAAEVLKSARLSPALEATMVPALESMYCGGLDDLSALQVAGLVSGLGGAINCLLGGFGMQSYIAEGTGALTAHLTAPLSEPVRLSTTVTHVHQTPSRVTIGCHDGHSLEVDYAVLALPATAVPAIDFDPPLPGPSLAAHTAVTFGKAAKVAAVVPRKRLLDATGFLGGPLLVGGWRSRNVVYGIAADGAADKPDDDLIADLLAGFGIAADGQTEVVRWNDDAFTHGTYVRYPPGRSEELRSALARPHGRVHFASAERSATWPVHMEGAVDSGIACAARIASLAS